MESISKYHGGVMAAIGVEFQRLGSECGALLLVVYGLMFNLALWAHVANDGYAIVRVIAVIIEQTVIIAVAMLGVYRDGKPCGGAVALLAKVFAYSSVFMIMGIMALAVGWMMFGLEYDYRVVHHGVMLLLGFVAMVCFALIFAPFMFRREALLVLLVWVLLPTISLDVDVNAVLPSIAVSELLRCGDIVRGGNYVAILLLMILFYSMLAILVERYLKRMQRV